MFVSRKNLSLIELVPAEAAARIDMAQLAHQRIESPGVRLALCKLQEPLAKGSVQGAALCAGNGTGTLDQVFVGAQGDVFHTEIVYTIFV
jgi:hypothetical protein